MRKWNKIRYFDKIMISYFISFGSVLVIFLIWEFRNYPPNTLFVLIFSGLFLSSIIFSVLVLIKRFRLHTEKILDSIQKSLKYCIKCGTFLESIAEGRCTKCGYKFTFKDLI